MRRRSLVPRCGMPTGAPAPQAGQRYPGARAGLPRAPRGAWGCHRPRAPGRAQAWRGAAPAARGAQRQAGPGPGGAGRPGRARGGAGRGGGPARRALSGGGGRGGGGGGGGGGAGPCRRAPGGGARPGPGPGAPAPRTLLGGAAGDYAPPLQAMRMSKARKGSRAGLPPTTSRRHRGRQ